LTPDLEKDIEKACGERGVTNPSAFIRAAIRNELTDRADRIQSTEQRIASALDRQATDIARLRGEVQALYTIFNAFVQIFLTCVPEPASEEYEAAAAVARSRYQKFIKAAGAAVASSNGKALAAGAGEES
jgi:hypothetical protein